MNSDNQDFLDKTRYDIIRNNIYLLFPSGRNESYKNRIAT